MHESELWITRIFNDYLPGLGNFFLGLIPHSWAHSLGIHAGPRPWADFIVMELLVVFLLAGIFPILRLRLSADRPGKLQQTFELVYGFVRGQADEQVGHDGGRYTPFFGTIFLFILVSNLIGIVPCFESPTMNPSVTAGCAVATFVYYNVVGLLAIGPWGTFLHFWGPLWWLGPLMFPIEIISHCARMLSLTVRLYANMFAGEKVTGVFLSLTKFLFPVIFMGLHVFVGVIQAYIFMLLAMVYVGGAVAHEH
jgi:F-type H+-transporting ATPase subunit a